MSNVTYIQRKLIKVDFFDLPFSDKENVDIINWKNIAIKIPGNKGYTDIGAFCFSDRKQLNCRNRNNFSVNLESFIPERAEGMKTLFENLYVDVKFGNKRNATVQSYICLACRYIDWCDNNDNKLCLSSIEWARIALAKYGFEQIHLLQSNVQSIRTSKTNYENAKSVVLIVFDCEPHVINPYIPIIRYSIDDKRIELLSEAEISRFRNFSKLIYARIFKFIINQEEFPFNLILPDESVWVFPTVVQFYTRERLKEKILNDIRMKVYDFENGKIFRINEIKNQYTSFGNANNAIVAAENLIEKSNSNPICPARLKLLEFSFECYIANFLSYIPINLSVLINIKWDGAYFIKTNKNIIFKGVKYRARGKVVSYKLPSEFRKAFLSYLRIRKYLVANISPENNPKTLFFMFHLDGNEIKTSSLKQNFCSSLNAKLRKRFDKDGLHFSSKQMRQSLANLSLNTKGPIETANLLQNDLSTTLKHYANGSELIVGNEMSNYFKLLNESIVIANNITNNEIPIGHCVDYGNPKNTVYQEKIESNCIQSEGCLFCKNYKVIKDEKDIRKLISLEYIIIETKGFAESIKDFDSVFGDVLTRISDILNILMKSERKLVEKVRCDVFDNGILSNYWKHKLQMFIDLGLV